MDLRTRLVVCAMIAAVLFWIFRSFSRHKLSSGQTLFWGTMLIGGFFTALFPTLVDLVSSMWGTLLPVSWISFIAILSLIGYLMHQSMVINAQQTRLTQLIRQTSFLERRLRSLQESGGSD